MAKLLILSVGNLGRMSRGIKQLSVDSEQTENGKVKIGEKSKWFFCSVLFCLSMLVCSSAMAQISCVDLAIDIDSSPMTAATTIREGDDFATQILNNPLDFSASRDFGYEKNFQVPTTASGVWTGTNVTSGLPGAVYPLFAGFAEKNKSNPLPSDEKLPRFGLNPANQILASKYSLLSFRFKHEARSDFKIEWTSNDLETGVATTSSYEFVDNFIPPTSGYTDFIGTNWNIYTVDFDTLSTEWENLISELKFIPSKSGALSGKKASFDWIRVVDPLSAPEITFTLNINTSFSATDCSFLASYPTYTIYADTDGVIGNADDTPIARYEYDSTAMNSSIIIDFPSAALPPGDYRFYADARDASAYPAQYYVSPNYFDVVTPLSSKLSITRNPRVVVTSPAPNTGDSYDDEVLGNSWQMDGPEDLANLDAAIYGTNSRNFLNDSYQLTTGATTSLRAKTGNALVFPRPKNPIDNLFEPKRGAQLHLATDPLNPIEPYEYRYLVYRMRADDGSNGGKSQRIDHKVRDNWFSQAVFWNTGDEFNYGWSKEQLVYEGWNTYIIDLWDHYSANGQFWLDYSRISNLRLQPLNSKDANVSFDVDYVKLYTENFETDGKYEIRYEIIDPGAPATKTYKVNYYYDTIDALFDGSNPISTETVVGKGAHSFLWNVPADLDGQYYVYVEIEDGDMMVGDYSSVPLILEDVPGSPASYAVAPMDYDGDGKSDNSVYRPSNGYSFQKRSDSESVFIPWVAGDEYHPLEGDFDGDGITDLGFTFEFMGWIGWYIFKSDTSLALEDRLYFRVWGQPGDHIVVGDYIGEGQDQIAVYRDGEWYILDENDGVYVFAWGEPGDVPVPADFDGDLVTDTAIWRPKTGEWWVLNSDINEEYFTLAQWGLEGDTPLAADWNGDGKADFGIFRPNGYLWAILGNTDYNEDGLNDGLQEIAQWGIPGDVPVVGDFNGDGHIDFTVYRPDFGMWFHNFRNKKTSTIQYGLPGDRVPGSLTQTIE